MICNENTGRESVKAMVRKHDMHFANVVDGAGSARFPKQTMFSRVGGAVGYFLGL